ncbi:alpha/beta hydrolase [Arthrobacter sp. NEB 688]|uniref:alpha/beta fold hydrolase n=1 Tax=Arthrobacter sp. NEB 688 TaxID=904039 RepID=UPI0015679AA1|nr:alpha/beta hydrolase [Arthrobacter sp. NEB 688]QKE84498.1 alpha/beta hydrolase [Arthrobacter sp. NEB 688]
MTARVDEQLVDVPGGLRICAVDEGPAGAPAVLLVAGLAQQLHSWPAPFVEGLLARGLRVVRLDNRDSGRSSRVAAPPPAIWRQLLARPRPDAYRLIDMAADAVAVLDHLGIEQVHLVGMSMGGMIAQEVAARHPDRCLSLVSVISTTGAPRVGQAAWSTKRRLVAPPARTAEKFVAAHLDMTAHLAGTGHPLDEEVERAYAALAWRRSGGTPKAAAAATARQIQAIQASGDRTAGLARVLAPTLVVHGDRDLIVHPSGGQATARAIGGARHVTVPGMGHHLAPTLLDRLVELVADHVQEAHPHHHPDTRKP